MRNNRTREGFRARDIRQAGGLALALACTTGAGCTTDTPTNIQDLTACTPGTTGCIPTRPSASTSSASDAMDVAFALRDLMVDQDDAAIPAAAQPWRAIGADLDGLQTSSSTSPNGCTAAAAMSPIDGNNGIDNQFGAELGPALVHAIDENLQNDVCCMQSRGRGTLLVRIRNWNGMPDDANVVLSITTALDGTSDDPATLAYDSVAENGYVHTGSSTPAATPSWAPDADSWFTSSDSLVAGDLDAPRRVDVNGYVSGGYFVMALDSTRPISIYLGTESGLLLGMHHARMVGHISANGHLIDDGFIAGRMDAPALLDMSYGLMASSLYSDSATGIPGGDPTSNALGCSTVAGQVVPLISNFGDVLASGTNSASTSCDAISAGFRFRGVRAKSVTVAPANLATPSPDCDGTPAVFGTPTPDETSCPFTGSSCSIRPWNSND